MPSKKRIPSSASFKPIIKTSFKSHIKEDYIASWDQILQIKREIQDIYRKVWEKEQEIQKIDDPKDAERIMEFHRQIGNLKGIAKTKELFVVDLAKRSNKMMDKKRRDFISILKYLNIEDSPWSGDPYDPICILGNGKTQLPNLEGRDYVSFNVSLELDQRNNILIIGDLKQDLDEKLLKVGLLNLGKQVKKFAEMNPDLKATMWVENSNPAHPVHLSLQYKMVKDTGGTSEREKFELFSEIATIVKEILQKSEEILKI